MNRSARQLRRAIYVAMREVHGASPRIVRMLAIGLEGAAFDQREAFRRDTRGAATCRSAASLLRALADLAELEPAPALEPEPPDAG
jgi:hypothetical protein